MVADDALGLTVLDHIRRHIALVAVDKAGSDVAVAIQFGDGVELVLVSDAPPALCAKDLALIKNGLQ